MQVTEKFLFNAEMERLEKIYRRPLDAEVKAIYWEDLKNYAWEDVKKAIQLHRQSPKSGKFMPKVADIIEQLQFLQAPGKPKASFQRCSIQADGCQCPLEATRGTLCSYHGHFSEHPDPTIQGYIMHLALGYPEQMLKPMRERDTHLFIKMCKQIEAGWEKEKQKEIIVKQAPLIRIEPKPKVASHPNEDERMRAVKDILIKQNSPWALEGRQ